MLNSPQVSLIMPVYNCQDYIYESISSILSQTFQNFELIIVNDGSTDNTEQVIGSFSDSRIVYLKIPNSGIGAALNFAIENANSDFLCRIDSDDICYNNRLQIQYDFMLKNPEIDFVGANADVITECGEYIYTTNQQWKSHSEIENVIFDLNPFIHPTVFYRKKIFEKIGGYYENRNGIYEDYNFHFRVVKNFKTVNIDEVVIKYRLRSTSFSVRNRSKKFWNLQKKFAITSELTEEEIDYLKIFNNSLKKNKSFLISSYFLTLSRLYKIKTNKTFLSIYYMLRSLKTYYFVPTRTKTFILLFLPKFVLKQFNLIK